MDRLFYGLLAIVWLGIGIMMVGLLPDIAREGVKGVGAIIVMPALWFMAPVFVLQLRKLNGR